jgi:hypothetical protein
MSWEDEDDWENAGNSPVEGGGLSDDQWAGEDADDDLLAGDDWDAEPGEEQETKKAPVVPGAKTLTKRQLAKKKEAEEKKIAEEKQRLANMTEEEKEELRAQERRKIEKNQIQSASDLFGDMGDLSIAVDDAVANQATDPDADNADMAAEIDEESLKAMNKKEEPKGVEDYPLEKMDDFKKFATEVGKKASKSVNKMRRGDSKKLEEFLKIMITEVCAGMSLEECNEVKKHFNSVYNAKAKDPSKKKKGKKGGAALKMSHGGGGYGNHGEYDALDDFF